MIGHRLLLVLFLGMQLSPVCNGQSPLSRSDKTEQGTKVERADKPPLRVRFDAIHSHTWIESVPIPGLNQYHLLSSPSRAAQSLIAMGCQVDVQLTAWDEDSLRNTDLVVLNLVSADRPSFRISEIQFLRDFVHRGGGLLIITDHTNCYFHNHVLEPLCEQLDLTLSSETACEKPPQTLSNGSGWIVLDSFRDHPILKGIEHLGFQTGGTVDQRFGIAWTSPASWGDAGRVPMYGEGADMGFPGDFNQEPFERTGPLAVVAAKAFGRGRIVVLGDQNAVGGLFLNYADNRKFWLQSALWATGYDQDVEDRISKGLAVESERSLIWCVEPFAKKNFYWGSTDRDRYYHAFAMLNKHADARATDKDMMQADWMIIPDPAMIQEPIWQSKVKEFTRSAKKHVVVFLSDGSMDGGDWITKWVAGDTQSLESDVCRTYILENGSTIQLWKQPRRWSNAQLLGPEAIRNDSDERWEELLLSPMRDLGLRRVKSFQELIQWPQE